MQMVVAVKDDRLSLTACKRKETQLSQTDTQRQDARLDARQDERQLPFAVTLAGRSDWHATMMQRCAHAHCVWLPHTWQD